MYVKHEKNRVTHKEKKYITVVILCTGWTDVSREDLLYIGIWLFAGGVVKFDG